MNSNFYIPRNLFTNSHSNTYSEIELLNNKFIIVLAEPGAGKTSLLTSLAHQLNTQLVSATRFQYVSHSSKSNQPILIDAFDELAKINAEKIYEVLGKIANLNPSKIILSSRSSEWYEEYTRCCEEFFGEKPLIVYLNPFNESEQAQIFSNYYPNENFVDFQEEIARFELNILLENPLFLRLFASAYKESGGKFEDKHSIFKLAIEYLAKESSQKNFKQPLSLSKKIELTEEIFAKLLLAGFEGVALSEQYSDDVYPHLISIISNEPEITQILSTQLFKPTDKSEKHKPVHKIITEYCAAKYLIRRLSDNSKIMLFSQCLAIIAPNSIVRDDLRGLVGWLAALGNQTIQEKLIDLDPYAVLANGDPSQLLPSSKRRLLLNLKKLAKEDPYFQRGDRWRSFSTVGFFTSDVIEEVKQIITFDKDEGDLKYLLLKLLQGSKVIPFLSGELKSIVLDKTQEDKYIRRQAGYCLAEINEYNHFEYLDKLIDEASNTSLSISANVISKIGIDNFKYEYIANFLRLCSTLYISSKQKMIVIGESFFISIFIEKLNLKTTEWLLDKFSSELKCTCGKKYYECECREGMSKIMGRLLDHYFELMRSPFDPYKIWKWVKNLHFKSGKDKTQSKSVKVLQENDELRQSIFRIIFENEYDSERIMKMKKFLFLSYYHSGLFLQKKDYWFIVDLAFQTNNPILWSHFIEPHRVDNKGKQSNLLRKHMRKQAMSNSGFLRFWVRNEIEMKKYRKKILSLHETRKKRCRQQKLKQRKIIYKAHSYIYDNWERIEQGKDLRALIEFSKYVLFEPDKIEGEFISKELVSNALYNCIDFISSYIPSLKNLTKTHGESNYLDIECVLYASCLEILKRDNNLSKVSSHLLSALRKNLNTPFLAVSNEQREKLKYEIDKLLFQSPKQAENFLREYIEPQLSEPTCKYAPVEWLRYDEIFQPFRSSLSLEWLERFPQMSFEAEKELFIQSMLYGDREKLIQLIDKRCTDIAKNYPLETENEEIEKRRNFWFLRAVFFLDENYEQYWNWLSQDKSSIFLLSSSFERIKENFPILSAIKLEMILNSFIGVWHKVDLPSYYGTESPAEQRAYRILTNLIYELEKDLSNEAISVLNRLLINIQYKEFYSELKSIRFNLIKKRNLAQIQIPTAIQIVELLDNGNVITVEGFRALIIDELNNYQADLNGSETTPKDIFYNNDKHIDEVQATQRVADRLRLCLKDKGITITLEHQLKNANRCDITCSKMINNQRKLLVIEAKGQWHKELYSAFKTQLFDKYSIHPDAEQQGIYLVLWFGRDEKIASKSNKQGDHYKINSADELKLSIEADIPQELKGLLDVFVLDISK